MVLKAFAREQVLIFVYARTDDVNFSTTCEALCLDATFSRLTGITGPYSDEALTIVDHTSAKVCR
jgi:hypothetical protein